MSVKKIWNRLFLEERPSISLSAFRIAVALTTGFHVIPTLCHLSDNYFPTAFKAYNTNFFTIEFIQWVQKSPETLIIVFVWIFCLSWLFFLIGIFSQVSCIVMTASCYYFYALNSFHVGTLSWDILLVTLFLMCLTPYHGDYFSLDCLGTGNVYVYKRRRPFFIQRLLQLQIGFTFFYTAMYKTWPQGNWFVDNPIHYLMNNPGQGVTKYFLLKDFLLDRPDLCLMIGWGVVVIEFIMIFILFAPRTRLAGIYLGIIFHVMLILTLDVPAIFFFLFPAQLLLFVDPVRIMDQIELARRRNRDTKKYRLLYDGKCHFCRMGVRTLLIMDLFNKLEAIDLHQVPDIKELHPDLTKDLALSQLHLVEEVLIVERSVKKLSGGFTVFRRLCLILPMMFGIIPLIYFPGVGILGQFLYRIIAKNRYLLHFSPLCRNNNCFR